MCGIAGVFDQDANLSPVSLNQRIAAMAATMVHRGPDDEGSWSDPSGGVVDDVQRVINENCQRLGFETHGFETE